MFVYPQDPKKTSEADILSGNFSWGLRAWGTRIWGPSISESARTDHVRDHDFRGKRNIKFLFFLWNVFERFSKHGKDVSEIYTVVGPLREVHVTSSNFWGKKKHRKLIFLKSQFLTGFECVKLESNFFGLHTMAILKSRPRHDQSVSIEMTMFISWLIATFWPIGHFSLSYIRLCSVWNGHSWYDDIVWWTSYGENSSETITQFVIVIAINKDMLQQQRKEPIRSIFQVTHTPIRDYVTRPPLQG